MLACGRCVSWASIMQKLCAMGSNQPACHAEGVVARRQLRVHDGRDQKACQEGGGQQAILHIPQLELSLQAHMRYRIYLDGTCLWMKCLVHATQSDKLSFLFSLAGES